MSSIQAKSDLADERPVSVLGKALQRALRAKGEERLVCVAQFKDAVDLYETRETTFGHHEMISLSSSLLEAEASCQDDWRGVKDFESTYPQVFEQILKAFDRKQHGLECNELARQVYGLPERENLQKALADIETTIQELESHRDRLQRICEHHRRQLERISYWAEVLETEMGDQQSPVSRGTAEFKYGQLYEFLTAVDKSFAVKVERLPELPASTRINFGGLFITNCLTVFWRDVERYPTGEGFLHYMVDWVMVLVDCVLNEVLALPPEESAALRQILIVHIPPLQNEVPEKLPCAENFVTLVSSMNSVSEEELNDFLGFMEVNPCIAPLAPVVYLRDLVVLLILHSSRENRVYNARTREVLFAIADGFALDPQAIRLWETSVGELLHGTSAFVHSEARVSPSTRWNQRGKIIAATVGGAAILAITGGLAIPAISAVVATIGVGLGSIGLGAVGSVLIGGSVVLGSIGIAGGMLVFGGVGAGLASVKLSKRWGDLNIEDFKFTRLKVSRGHRGNNLLSGSSFNKSTSNEIEDPAIERNVTDTLELAVCVSGYLRNSKDYNDPWKCMRKYGGGLCDTYALRWEKENLSKLGSVLLKMMATELAGSLTSAWLNATMGAVAAPVAAPVMIISVMSDLDNYWLVVRDRAYQCGEALAYSLTNEEAIGLRPVTLVGYSMGALAIFTCLQKLAETGHYNRVQNVVLIGAPIPSTFALDQQKFPWWNARAVVSGRLINCYNPLDAMLGFLCRFLEWGIHIAGVGTVDQPGIENYNVGDLVNGHSDYPAKTREILEHIGFIR